MLKKANTSTRTVVNFIICLSFGACSTHTNAKMARRLKLTVRGSQDEVEKISGFIRMDGTVDPSFLQVERKQVVHHKKRT